MKKKDTKRFTRFDFLPGTGVDAMVEALKKYAAAHPPKDPQYPGVWARYYGPDATEVDPDLEMEDEEDEEA